MTNTLQDAGADYDCRHAEDKDLGACEGGRNHGDACVYSVSTLEANPPFGKWQMTGTCSSGTPLGGGSDGKPCDPNKGTCQGGTNDGTACKISPPGSECTGGGTCKSGNTA